VALGPEPVTGDARARVHAYCAFTGTPERTVSGLLTSPAEVRTAISAFAALGAGEVIFHCHGTGPGQVDRLADLL
jgi:hypothetical protein